MSGPLTPAEMAQWQSMFLPQGGTPPAGPPTAPIGPPPPPAAAPAPPPIVATPAAKPAHGAMTPLSDYGIPNASVAKKNTSGLDLGFNLGNLNAAPAPITPPNAEPWVEPSKETFAKPVPAGMQLGGASQPMQLTMPVPPKPVYVAGGWGPSSRSGVIKLTGDEKANFANADENLQQANETHTQVAAQTADMVAAKLNGQQAGIERADADMQRREHDRNLAGQEAVSKLQTLTKDVNDAANIDPQKFWDDKPGFAKVIAAIGVAVGGFVAGRTGGPNQALDQIERAIDRNVDAQKARFAAARGKLDEQKGVYATMRQQFGDERMADEAAKHAYLENAERQVHNLIADNASKDIQARGQEILAGIQERKGMRAIELEKLAQGNLTEKYRPGGFVGGAAPASTADPKLFVPTGSNNQGYVARTEKEAIEGRALQDARQSLIPKLERLKQLRGESQGGRALNKVGWETEEVAEIKSLQGQVALGLKNLEQAGALDKGMQELAGQVTGDWTTLQGHPEKAADSLIADIHNKVSSHERGQGAQGAQQSIAVDAQGRPVAVTNGQFSFAAPRAEMPSSFKPAGGAAAQPTYQSPQKAQPWDGQIAPTKGGNGGKGGKSSGKGPLSADEKARYEEIIRSYPKDGQ